MSDNNSNIQFNIPTKQSIKEIVDESIQGLLYELSAKFKPKEPTEFLTRKDVSELLKVNISTVHNWTVKGVLKSYQIGEKRVYYKRLEVEEALTLINAK